MGKCAVPCSHQGAEATLCQVFKEALADSEQGPVVALEDGGGGHHQLGLRVNLRHLIQALTNPGPPSQAQSGPAKMHLPGMTLLQAVSTFSPVY